MRLPAPGIDSPGRDALAAELRRALDEDMRYDDDDWTRLADAALTWAAEQASPRLSAEHALRAGMVWGLAMEHGLDLTPVVDEAGNYTAAVTLRSDRLPEGVTITLVVLPPDEVNP